MGHVSRRPPRARALVQQVLSNLLGFFFLVLLCLALGCWLGAHCGYPAATTVSKRDKIQRTCYRVLFRRAPAPSEEAYTEFHSPRAASRSAPVPGFPLLLLPQISAFF